MNRKTTLLIGVLVLVIGLTPAGVALAQASSPEPVLVHGQVIAITSTSITLSTREGPKVIQTDESTRYHVPSVRNPGLDDFAVGDKLIVLGLRQEDGSILARRIGVVPPRPRPVRVRGEITSIQGTTIKLATERGDKTITTDERTRYFIPGVENPGLDDIHVDDEIVVVGFVLDDGRLLARLVIVLLPLEGPGPTPPAEALAM